MSARAVDVHALPAMLTALRLPSFHRHWQAFTERADKEGWPATRFLVALAEIELAGRDTRRIRRHPLEANLPAGKTLATFDFEAIPSIPRARIEALAAGDRLETGANLIAIGNSRAGKTHLLSAIAHALVEAERRVLYTRTTDLVQRLQAARCDLTLEQPLARLDPFDLAILDDITCAQRDQSETGVIFELIARRYDTRSLAIAAIDRLVHHATILKMNVDSFRCLPRPDDATQPARRQHPPPTTSMPTSTRLTPTTSPTTRKIPAPEPPAASASTSQLGCRLRSSVSTRDTGKSDLPPPGVTAARTTARSVCLAAIAATMPATSR